MKFRRFDDFVNVIVQSNVKTSINRAWVCPIKIKTAPEAEASPSFNEIYVIRIPNDIIILLLCYYFSAARVFFFV